MVLEVNGAVVSLRTGDVVLTGALGPMVAIKPRDHVRAAIGGLGECSFSFEGGR